jgi:hypothetical protein
MRLLRICIAAEPQVTITQSYEPGNQSTRVQGVTHEKKSDCIRTHLYTPGR